MMRVSKQVSPRGDDYTAYRNMSWYWYNPSHDTADLDRISEESRRDLVEERATA